MKKVFMGMALAMVCSAAPAFAIEETTAVSYTDQSDIIDRFRYLERVDVTADKPVVEEQLDPELQRLLDEVEAIEEATNSAG
ncbi:MAG: hypothetical protein HC809_13960 [Gammaproteobacteria bacterium]|nr:hypothetical protein [Gammaproteobacteria bacterium]